MPAPAWPLNRLAWVGIVAAMGCGDGAATTTGEGAAPGSVAPSSVGAGGQGPSGVTVGSGGAGGMAPSCPMDTVQVSSRQACAGQGPIAPSALSMAAATGIRGDIVGLGGLDVPGIPCAPVLVCRPMNAPTLLFSDEPETTATDGILYADVIAPGRYRAYVYHVNAGSAPRKFPIVVLNQEATAATITISRRGVAGSTIDYVAAGKSAVVDWLAATGATVVSVPPGQRVLLDANLDARHAQKNELVHAIFDFEVDRTVKLSVVSVPANADAAAVTSGLSVVPSSGLHVRGTFPFAAYTLVGDGVPDPGVRSLLLGANLVDPDLAGHSFVDGGASVILHGGFGVSYDLSWPAGNELGLVLSPRGGAWGGAANMGAGEDLAAGVVPLPTAQTTLDPGSNGIHAGRFAKGSTATMTLMSGGGSSLPVALLFVPLGG